MHIGALTAVNEDLLYVLKGGIAPDRSTLRILLLSEAEMSEADNDGSMLVFF